MPDPIDVQELARSLEKMSANLARHIKDEGLKIGAALGKSHAKAADERIKDEEFKLQRATDLVAELRRQRKPLEAQADKYADICRAVRQARNAGQTHIDINVLLDIMHTSAKEN